MAVRCLTDPTFIEITTRITAAAEKVTITARGCHVQPNHRDAGRAGGCSDAGA